MDQRAQDSPGDVDVFSDSLIEILMTDAQRLCRLDGYGCLSICLLSKDRQRSSHLELAQLVSLSS
jgi:hypothetical protein